MPPADTSSSDPDCGCKVVRVSQKYGLSDFLTQLPDRWTGQRSPKSSVRELTDEFNTALLRARLTAEDVEPVSGEAENLYRLLTDESVTRADRMSAEGRLRRAGVDVDRLCDDFVSHWSIHNHLTSCLDVANQEDQDTTPTNRRKKAAETIFGLENRTAAVTESTIERLRTAQALNIGEVDVLVTQTVICRECGVQVSVEELLDGYSCECFTS